MKWLVVTPTLGVSPWLAETVASVAALSGDHTHMLVAPAEKGPSLRARFPHVLVTTEPGGGMYAAINTGLSAVSDWDAFTYLNDDDCLLPAFSQMVQQVAPRAAGRLIAYGGVKLIDRVGRRLGAIPVSPLPRLNRDLYAQRIEPVYQHGTLVTRPALAQLGGFNSRLLFCGDSEFLARACITGVPFVRVTSRPVAAFRLHAGQLTKNRAVMRAERAAVDVQLDLRPRRITGRHRFARWVFRTANLPIYAERIARHGFVSFDEMLTRLG